MNGAVIRFIGVLAVAIALAPAGADAWQGRGDFAGLVGIGGARSIYLECHGRGSPTVILEAGLRSRSDFWSVRPDDSTPTPTVLPGVARFTRVCTYDRPGTTLGTEDLSRSTPVPMPRTARDAVSDLHALLAAARVPGPYVLAGHSTGGLIVRLYGALHPRRIRGLVLVDALSEFLRGPLSPEQIAVFDELNNGPLPGLEGYADLEQILFRPSFAQMARAAKPRTPRDIPVEVISRALPLPLPDGLPAGLNTPVVESAWRVAQRRLAHQTPDTRWRIARQSSHYVMFSQPGLIIKGIRRVVRLARTRPSASSKQP